MTKKKQADVARRKSRQPVFRGRKVKPRPATLDRIAVTYLAGALAVWVACLVILWGWAFDTSGSSSVLTLAAALLAVAIAAPLPGRIARAFQRMLIWLGLLDVGVMELTMAAPVMSRRKDALATVRLLGVAAVFIVACGAASTLAILGARSVAEHLAAQILLTGPAWTMLKIVLQLVGMLPMALGVCVAFLLGVIIRGGPGRDPYAAAVRDWIWALAAGLAVFGIAWRAGGNLLGLVVVSAVAMLAAAVWLMGRGRETARPQRRGRPIDKRPEAALALGVGVSFALLSLICAIQWRMLTDVAGAGMCSCACWIALWLVPFAAAMKDCDEKSALPAPVNTAGAAVAVVAAAVFQSVLAMASVGGGVAAIACAVLAVAAQVPLVACGAMILSRQRRVFAGAGGRPRTYLSLASAGSACGLLAYLAMGWAGMSAIWLMALAIAVLAAGAVCGITSARKGSLRIRWALCSAALAGSLAAAVVISLGRAHAAAGRVQAGAWLTSIHGAGGAFENGGFLPAFTARHERSSRVTDFARGVFSERRGLWWIIAGSQRDLPGEPPMGFLTVACSVDPSAWSSQRHRNWPALRSSGKDGTSPDFFRPASLGERLFDGIFLAAMPADAPQAWRCYNKETLARCISRLDRKNGVVAIRTQSSGGRLSAALAAVATLHSVVGPSWVAMDLDGASVDLMAVGPAERIRPPEARNGLHLLRSDELLKAVGQSRTIRILSPAGALVGGPSVQQLRRLLTERQ